MKKGLAESSVVIFVLALISFVVLSLILTGLINTAEASSERTKCRDLIQLSEKIKTFRSIDPYEVCETEFTYVESTDKEEVYLDIADSLYWTWWRFKNTDPESVKSFFQLIKNPKVLVNTDRRYCYVGSVIEFSEQTQEKIPEIDTLELLEYFRDTPNNEADGNSFWDFFYPELQRSDGVLVIGNEERPDEYNLLNQLNRDGINTNIDTSKNLQMVVVLQSNEKAAALPGFGYHFIDHVREGDKFFYEKGLKFSIGNIFEGKVDRRDYVNFEEYFAQAVFVIQDPIDDLKLEELCNA